MNNKSKKALRKSIKKMQKQVQTQKGITLVALVITIIILIILATVAINFAFGNNGLIQRAEDARDYYANDTSYTDESITNVESYLDELINGVESGDSDGEDIPIEPEIPSTVKQAKESGTEFTEETTITDEIGNEITVPAGFKIASDSGDTVQQGIVIEDVSASTDSAVQGSQYVWIPVGSFTNDNREIKEVILGRYTFADDEYGTPTLVQVAFNEEGTEDGIPDNIPDYTEQGDSIEIEGIYKELLEYREGYGGTLDAANTTAKDLKGFLNSARDNGGYYIGRYEASYASDNKAASKISTATATTTTKYEKGMLMNFIDQFSASEFAINTYVESTSISSDLMNSYAWDTAIVYIQQAGNKNYANQNGKLINGSLANTGLNGDEVCKINDMSSNVYEWTTENSNYYELYSPQFNVYRGEESTISRTYAGGSFSIYNGFRILLYW